MTKDPPVWLFDGHCVLCSRGVQFLLKHERDHDVRFVALTSDQGQDLARTNGLDPADPISFLFIEHGRALQASDAVLAMMRHIKGWRMLSPVLALIPRFIRDAAYHWIARNRYRVFGRFDACIVPDAAQRHRFMLPS
jgi:predicted DCC family thiol-disulfide oxidoreductase YuxK